MEPCVPNMSSDCTTTIDIVDRNVTTATTTTTREKRPRKKYERRSKPFVQQTTDDKNQVLFPKKPRKKRDTNKTFHASIHEMDELNGGGSSRISNEFNLSSSAKRKFSSTGTEWISHQEQEEEDELDRKEYSIIVDRDVNVQSNVDSGDQLPAGRRDNGSGTPHQNDSTTTHYLQRNPTAATEQVSLCPSFQNKKFVDIPDSAPQAIRERIKSLTEPGRILGTEISKRAFDNLFTPCKRAYISQVQLGLLSSDIIENWVCTLL